MDYENSVLIIKVAGINVSRLRLLNVQYMTYIYILRLQTILRVFV